MRIRHLIRILWLNPYLEVLRPRGSFVPKRVQRTIVSDSHFQREYRFSLALRYQVAPNS